MSKDREYFLGLVITVLSAASLADHITDGIGSMPISAVLLGVGIVLMARSYRK